MLGFLGKHIVSMDGKGRITVPSKFRTVLEKNYGSELAVCLRENYLLIFPEKEWQVNESNFNSFNAFDESLRKERRARYPDAESCEIKSGKILIPAEFRQEVGLKKDVILIGMSNTFEVWALDRWEKETG